MFGNFCGKIFRVKIFSWSGGYHEYILPRKFYTRYVITIVAAGTSDESEPFGSGKPSLRCRYRSRAILATLSCVAVTYT